MYTFAIKGLIVSVLMHLILTAFTFILNGLGKYISGFPILNEGRTRSDILQGKALFRRATDRQIIEEN